MRMAVDPEKRFTFTIARGTAGSRQVAVSLRDLKLEQVEHLRDLLAGRLGAGFEALVDGEVVARGPESAGSDVAATPAVGVAAIEAQANRLIELTVQQHEYCYAELQRMRRDYEEEFAQERAILRTLRQRWMEWVCDDKVRIEDVMRFVGESVASAIKGKGEGEGSG